MRDEKPGFRNRTRLLTLQEDGCTVGIISGEDHVPLQALAPHHVHTILSVILRVPYPAIDSFCTWRLP
jgi:hypothetical protein